MIHLANSSIMNILYFLVLNNLLKLIKKIPKFFRNYRNFFRVLSYPPRKKLTYQITLDIRHSCPFLAPSLFFTEVWFLHKILTSGIHLFLNCLTSCGKSCTDFSSYVKLVSKSCELVNST